MAGLDARVSVARDAAPPTSPPGGVTAWFRLRRAATVVAAAVVLIFLFQALRRAHRPDGNDFTSYLLSARALLEGTDPYATGSRFSYLYPLTLAFFLLPLLAVPYSLAVVVWFALNVLAIADIVRLSLRAAGVSSATAGSWGAAAAVLAAWVEPIQNDLLNGQVNIIVVALVLRFLCAEISGTTRAGPIALGAAIALKIVPVVLLGFLVVRRRFRAAALAALCAVSLMALPALLFYGGEAGELYARYFRTVLVGNVEHPLEFPATFSIAGAVTRWITPSIERLQLNLFSAAAVFAVVLAADAIASRARHPARDFLMGCAYLLAVLLAIPVSEIHHFMLAMPAALVLAGESSGSGLRRLSRDPFAIATGATLALVFASRFDKTGPGYFVSASLLFGLALFAAGRRRAGVP